MSIKAVLPAIIVMLALVSAWAFALYSEEGDRAEITRDVILEQQHRPHEVEEVEAGKLDIDGNPIDAEDGS